MMGKVKNRVNNYVRNLKGFSLVELIVVIAIVAILSVTGFLTLQKRISQSRDSNRLSDLETIKKSLTVNYADSDTNEVYPMPDEAETVTGDDGETLWNQGHFGTSAVSKVSNLNQMPKDPRGSGYEYSVTMDQQTYEVYAKLENGGKVSFVNSVYAKEDYYIVRKGNYNGYIKGGTGSNYNLYNSPSLYMYSGSQINSGRQNYVYNEGDTLSSTSVVSGVDISALKDDDSSNDSQVYQNIKQKFGLDTEDEAKIVVDRADGGATETSGSETVDKTWYDSSWNHRKKITIHHEQVSGDLSDFPVYVDLGDMGSDFFDNVKSGCGDIRVTKGDKLSEVPREVVSCDKSNNKGELHFKAPSLSSSSDTIFYIYYGNSNVSDYAESDTYGAQNVWTNNYAMVQHLNETSGDALDSTSYNNDGTTNGGVTQGATGQVGEAYNFDGSDDYINAGNNFQYADDESFSVAFWYNRKALTNNDRIMGFRTIDGWGFLFDGGYYDGGEDLVFRYDGNNLGVIDGNNKNQWYYYILTYDGEGKIKVYIDGSQTNSQTGVSWTIPSYYFQIGSAGGYSDNNDAFFDGIIDEVHISSNTRSSSWISATYTNQNSPTTFYSPGSQENL